MTLELLHEVNPTGQRGIWKHSQNVEDDLLKRYVVQVQRQHGWLAMKSFNTAQEANEYIVTDKEFDELFPLGYHNVRVWDDRKNQTILNLSI